MKGVYLTYTTLHDGQRKLQPRLEEHVIAPELGHLDVLVQVKACALSRIDVATLLDITPNAEQFPVGQEISGVVSQVGLGVTNLSINDEVCGILPLDSEGPGCAEYCIAPQYCLVKKPPSMDHADCVSILRPSLRAYTALFYQTSLDSNAVVLLYSAATADGVAIINLCDILGFKVIAVVNSAEEAEKLSHLQPDIYKILNTTSTRSIVDVCRHETGGIGVQCIIDQGVSPGYNVSDFIIDSSSVRRTLISESNRYSYEESLTSLELLSLPRKQDIINMLAVQGHWITSQPSLQLEPPETKLLFLKGANIHFLFDNVWTLSGTQVGKYMHILTDALKKLSEKLIRPYIQETISLEQALHTGIDWWLRIGCCNLILRISDMGAGTSSGTGSGGVIGSDSEPHDRSRDRQARSRDGHVRPNTESHDIQTSNEEEELYSFFSTSSVPSDQPTSGVVLAPPLTIDSLPAPPLTMAQEDILQRFLATLQDHFSLTFNIDLLLESCQVQTVPSSATLLKRGTECKAVYVILEGVAHILGRHNTMVTGHLTCGNVCGEVATLLNCANICSIIAVTEMTVIRIPVKDFLESIGGTRVKQSSIREWCIARSYIDTNDVFDSQSLIFSIIHKSIESCGLFGSWSNKSLLSMARYSTLTLYNDGDVIIKNGEPSSFFVIISKGSVKVNKDGRENVVTGLSCMESISIGINDFFNDVERGETAIAASPVLAVLITREIMLAVLDEHDNQRVRYYDLLQNYRTSATNHAH